MKLILIDFYIEEEPDMQNLVCHFVPGALKERLEVRSGCAREAAWKDAPSRTRHTLSSKMDSNKKSKIIRGNERLSLQRSH